MRAAKYISLLTVFVIAGKLSISQTIFCSDKTVLPGIVFPVKQVKLNSKNKLTLDSIIMMTNKCPGYSLVMSAGFSEVRHRNALTWDRINQTFLYLNQNGIDSARILIRYDNRTGYETISFRLELTETANEPSPPHPNLRKTEADKPKNKMP